MSLIPPRVMRMLELLRSRLADTDFGETLDQSRSGAPMPRLRVRKKADASSVSDIWARLRKDSGADSETQAEIADALSVERAGLYSGNIENYIGTVKLPVGVVGPLRVNGINAQGDYFVPLATTEAALVASYARGADIVSWVGGISAATIAEGVLRTPAFVFSGMVEATLPNILVGSVGGGTGLPSQQAGLKMMGLAGAGKAAALAEVTAALCLCGEISIIGAMAAGHFTRAHEKLARQR